MEKKSEFHPVIFLPPGCPVLDLRKGRDPSRKPGEWGIGKYNEKREGMYTTELFAGSSAAGARNIHLGIDLSGPVGTPIHAFSDGEVFLTKYNSAAGDYGYTVITKHSVEGKPLFALHGHLSARSVENKIPGQKIRRGEIIAWIGDVHENGGWDMPHLHFQISREAPASCDMPGVAAEAGLDAALKLYPDPRLVLGPLY